MVLSAVHATTLLESSVKTVSEIMCDTNHYNCTACSDGEVKLVGGTKTSQGTVEVCYYNLWGLVSDANWNDKAASVVCRQLGFNAGTSKPLGFPKLLVYAILLERPQGYSWLFIW